MIIRCKAFDLHILHFNYCCAKYWMSSDLFSILCCKVYQWTYFLIFVARFINGQTYFWSLLQGTVYQWPDLFSGLCRKVNLWPDLTSVLCHKVYLWPDLFSGLCWKVYLWLLSWWGSSNIPGTFQDLSHKINTIDRKIQMFSKQSDINYLLEDDVTSLYWTRRKSIKGNTNC